MQITYSHTGVIRYLYHVNYYYNCSYLRADEILYSCRERRDVNPRTLLVVFTCKLTIMGISRHWIVCVTIMA